jgi:Tol biopolymer transport system component
MEHISARIPALVVLVLALVCAQGATAVDEQVPDSLVFERNGDLYRMAIDGSETVRMTNTPVRDELDPAVSPGALSVAFERTTIWRMTLDARNQTRVTSRLGDADPAWSPDGDEFYFTRSSPNSFGDICGSIFRIGADGRGLARVTRGAPDHSHFQPSVSVDGRVAFAVADGCFGGPVGCLYLRVVDRSGRPTSDLRRLGRCHDYVEPSWSPDGSRLAFSSAPGSGGVFVSNRDGSGLRRLTPKRLEAHEPAWSPDGEWIAFAGPTGLHLVRPDGSGLRRAPGTRRGDESPAWLPRR